jgi:hypothetical protein
MGISRKSWAFAAIETSKRCGSMMIYDDLCGIPEFSHGAVVLKSWDSSDSMSKNSDLTIQSMVPRMVMISFRFVGHFTTMFLGFKSST